MSPHHDIHDSVNDVEDSLHNSSVNSLPHPLDQLTVDESDRARDIITAARGKDVIIRFRSIYAEEPAKQELLPYLRAEHAQSLNAKTPRPARLARMHYDVLEDNKKFQYTESTVDIGRHEEISHEPVGNPHHSNITVHEFKDFTDAVLASPKYKEAIANLEIPSGFVIVIDPWPYGGPDPGELVPRYMQGLCFARDDRHKNDDSNHYGYPIPIIPVLDTATMEVVRVDELVTGGKEDGMNKTFKPNVLDHCKPAEYVPELLSTPLRTDLKALNVTQPDGPSFKVSNESLVEWQKWRFRVGFTPREGAVLHDVHYDGRSVLYRLSLSEMTVPYADPRSPYHRKQAFDFGDAGAGRAANNLSLGCDCLGTIKYFDALMTEANGSSSVSKNVVCLHEQDNGIGWKHTNFRTQRAVVTRSRELVVQFIITLANYEYIFAYKLDQAGGITVETRATGIVSVVNIDPGKTSPWGNVVSSGAMAQNHQHIFCVRIDPAIDGHSNTIISEESLPMPMTKDINPFGNAYEVRQTPVTKSSFLDASPTTNRTIKMTNSHIRNPISGKPVSYKFIPAATQLLLAHPDSVQAKRAQFAQHHVWVTKYKDGEFWAGGDFTNQSEKEVGGLADAVARDEDVLDTDVVVWNVFGLTHNPRVEDWPVMPVEIHQLHIKPSDFFSANPAMDVPGSKNTASVLANGGSVIDNRNGSACCANGSGQADPVSHLQGTNQTMDPNNM